MKKLNGLFTNVDRALKVIAKVLFYICFFAGIILLVYGLYQVIDLGGNDSYYERQKAFVFLGSGVGVMVASLMSLPLYAFGELISLCKEMRADMKKAVGNSESQEESK